MTDLRPAIELYQAEWCPHSHRVRQRLTELGLDFVARQVPADPAERADLERATGQRSIPTLILDEGTVLGGHEEILAALDQHVSRARGGRAPSREGSRGMARVATARSAAVAVRHFLQ